MNSDLAKEMRRDFMSGTYPKICKRCENVDKAGGNSYRQHIVNSVSDTAAYQEVFDSTQIDGTISNPKIVFWDVRYSSLCNFKCRTCSEVSSSAIHFEKFGTRPIKIMEERPDLFEIFKQELPNIKRVKVSGGEPTLMREFWDVLTLSSESNSDIVFTFNTNASVTSYKGKSIFDELSKLKNCTVTLSLDDIGRRAEYLRNGTIWSEVEANSRKYIDLGKYSGGWMTNIIPTISVYNVFYINELINMYKNDVHVNLSPVINPFHLCVNILPKELKRRCVDTLSSINHKNVFNVSNIVNLLKEEPPYRVLEMRKKLIDEIEHLDKIRNESFGKNFHDLIQYFYDPRFLTDRDF
jgi:organic radical activating enzyme